MTIRFGTDGWRAVIAEDFTYSAVRDVSRAVARLLLRIEERSNPPSLVVGFDRRFSSDAFARVAVDELSAEGIDVYFCTKPVASPILSYTVTDLEADGALIITASHNPHQFSGIKLKTAMGASAPRAFGRRVEGELAQPSEVGTPEQRGRIREHDPLPAYLERVGKLVNLERIRDAGLTIASDAMFGVASGLLPQAAGGESTQIVEINTAHNPLFPGLTGPEPVEPNLTRLKKIVSDGGAHIGVAFDGDGDRIGVVDETGHYVSSQQLFGLLARYVIDVRGDSGPIVKSVTGTAMVDVLAERASVPVIETATGFPHIAEAMIEEGASIGGEESGGFAFGFHIPDRDGLLSALLLIDYTIQSGKTLSQLLADLASEVGPWAYRRVDLPLSKEARHAANERWGDIDWPSSIAGLNISRVVSADGTRVEFEDGSWLLARLSGTEPLLRLYVETHDTDTAVAVLASSRDILGV